MKITTLLGENLETKHDKAALVTVGRGFSGLAVLHLFVYLNKDFVHPVSLQRRDGRNMNFVLPICFISVYISCLDSIFAFQLIDNFPGRIFIKYSETNNKYSQLPIICYCSHNQMPE